MCIPSKDDWRNQTIDIPDDIICYTDDIICYTDGTRHLGPCQSGASVFNQMLNQEHVLPLGKYSTIFQVKYMLSWLVLTLCIQSMKHLLQSALTVRQH